MIAKCLKRECGNLFTAQDLSTAQCPVCKNTVVCNGDSDAALVRQSMRKVPVVKESSFMKYNMHVYQCDSCVALFAAEDHPDLDHADIDCPFCMGENVSETGYGELQITKLPEEESVH